MNIVDIINTIIVIIGIPVLVGFFIDLGRKMQVLDDLKNTTDKIKHNIKTISDRMIADPNMGFDPSKLQSFSPLNLTEQGSKYLEDIGFVNLFKENKENFFIFINKEEPKTKYDVEVAAIKSVFVLFHKEYFVPIKTHLYNTPTESFKSLSQVAGVYIRDEYFKEHPEITE